MHNLFFSASGYKCSMEDFSAMVKWGVIVRVQFRPTWYLIFKLSGWLWLLWPFEHAKTSYIPPVFLTGWQQACRCSLLLATRQLLCPTQGTVAGLSVPPVLGVLQQAVSPDGAGEGRGSAWDLLTPGEQGELAVWVAHLFYKHQDLNAASASFCSRFERERCY